jgi:putative hemolysin
MLTVLSSTYTHEVAEPGDALTIITEVESLPPDQHLVTQGGFSVFIARAQQIPRVLQEIGRLREITFREVGEGTGNPYDLDEYDNYYWQLFIWDRKAKCIAGGYRIGEGDIIYKERGIDGFYISSLFVIDPDFSSVLSQCIELGRSYVVQAYQKKRLPLFLLWKGILYFLLKHGKCRYLIGPVSISKFYSDLSKSLIVAFVKEHYFDEEHARYITPRKPFTVPLSDVNLQLALKELPDIEALENFLEHIEPHYFRLPILLKQYIRQNARFIGFNLDPNFNDALDGLMLLDLLNVRPDTIENLSKSW